MSHLKLDFAGRGNFPFGNLINNWLDSKKTEDEISLAMDLLNNLDIGSSGNKAPNKFSYKSNYTYETDTQCRLFYRLSNAANTTNSELQDTLKDERTFIDELTKIDPSFGFASEFSITRLADTPGNNTFLDQVHSCLTQAVISLNKKKPENHSATPTKQAILTDKPLTIHTDGHLFYLNTNKTEFIVDEKTNATYNTNKNKLNAIQSCFSNIEFNLHGGFGTNNCVGKTMPDGAAKIYDIVYKFADKAPSDEDYKIAITNIYEILTEKTRPRYGLFGFGKRDPNTTELYQKLENFVHAEYNKLFPSESNITSPRIMR